MAKPTVVLKLIQLKCKDASKVVTLLSQQNIYWLVSHNLQYISHKRFSLILMGI